MHLTWDDVDLNRGRITLNETKNDERRTVPLVGHALEIIKAHAKVRQLEKKNLFPSRGPRSYRAKQAPPSTKPMDLRAPWKTALNMATIEDFRFHDLRHSAASYLAMNGASLPEIAEVLGHKTLQMVQRYAHLSESHTAKVVASMNAKIFA